MIDTHTHLYLPEFPDGGDEQVKNAIGAGVNHLVFPNVDRDTISPMLALHNRFPENTSVAMGLHPTEVDENWKEVVADMQKLIAEGGFVAVGKWVWIFIGTKRIAMNRCLHLPNSCALQSRCPCLLSYTVARLSMKL